MFGHGLIIFNPKNISGLTVWLDAANPSNNGTRPTTGSTLSTWVNIGVLGSAGNATATAGNEPTYRTTTPSQNGLPVVDFDGVDNFMTIADNAALDFTSGFTIFVAMQNTDQTAVVMNKRSAGGNAYQLATIINSSPSPTRGLQLISRGMTSYSDTELLSDSTNLYVWQTSATEGAIYQNGTNIATFAGDRRPTDVAATNVTIGSERGTSLFVNGFYCEILMYDSSLTSGQRTLVSNYLREKWAIY